MPEETLDPNKNPKRRSPPRERGKSAGNRAAKCRRVPERIPTPGSKKNESPMVQDGFLLRALNNLKLIKI